MSAGSNYLNEMNFHWCSLSYLHNSWARLSYFCSYEFTKFIFPWKRCSNTSIPRTTKPKQIKPWVNRWSNCVALGEGLLVVPHLVFGASSGFKDISFLWDVTSSGSAALQLGTQQSFKLQVICISPRNCLLLFSLKEIRLCDCGAKTCGTQDTTKSRNTVHFPTLGQSQLYLSERPRR